MIATPPGSESKAQPSPLNWIFVSVARRFQRRQPPNGNRFPSCGDRSQRHPSTLNFMGAGASFCGLLMRTATTGTRTLRLQVHN